MIHRIRRAGLGDAQALSRISISTFTETFGHMYPDEDLQDFMQTHYSVEASDRLLVDPAYAVWLLTDDDENIAGYAVAGTCGLPHDEATPQDGELKRLYLLASAQGSGAGSRIFQTALDWLERHGPRTIWISVWSQNFGAQRFYRRWGFAKVAEYEFIVGRQRDHEFMYRRQARVA